MTELVIDTSVAVKWFLNEPDSKKALMVLQDSLHGKTQMHAPSFLRLELDSVLTRRVAAGFVQKDTADQIRASLERMPVQWHEIDALRNDTFRLALETRQSIYDCLFLALAITLAAGLVTADVRFIKGLRASILRDRVMGLAEYPRSLE